MTQHEVKRGERRNGWRGSQPIWGGPTKIPYVVRALGAHGHSRRFDDVRVTSAFAPIATRKLTLRRVSNWARIGLVPFWPNMEARGSEASSRAGLLLVGYLASRCCVNHSVAGPAEASKSFT